MNADGHSGDTCTQHAEPWGCFRSWRQGKEAEQAGQGPKNMRKKGGKMAILCIIPCDGDLKSPARMPLPGARQDF